MRIISDNQEMLELDYKSTLDNYKWLADVRFKLLGLVPTASVIASSILSRGPGGNAQLAIAIFGWLATLGIAFYELRNSALYDATIHRLACLERDFGFQNFSAMQETGGSFRERPAHQRFLGFIIKNNQGSFVPLLHEKLGARIVAIPNEERPYAFWRYSNR